MSEESKTVTVRYDATHESPIDIHKLIDDAMEKKDRCLNIFITNVATSVYVYPCDDTEPKWTEVTAGYVCSECGQFSGWDYPYCPTCGEKMHGVKEKEK